ncbi:MAG: hypothetical protein ACK4NF_05905, partial [Planctomycetota bacterium]
MQVLIIDKRVDIKVLIYILFLTLTLYTENIKSQLKNNIKNLLIVPNYNKKIYASVRINELQKYFETLDIKLKYYGKKKVTIVKGVPDLPNQNILSKLLTQAVKRIWDYISFPYLFDILSDEKKIKMGSIKKESEKYSIIIPDASRAIREATYILDKNYLPQEIILKYANNKTGLIKLEFTSIESGK